LSLALRFPIESQNPLDDEEEELVEFENKFEDDSINLEFGQVYSPQTSDPYDIS